MTDRLPGDEGFGDPLSTAGITPVEMLARGVSAPQPERESVGGELLVSDAAVELVDAENLKIGRPRRLRAGGAPRDMHVVGVSRTS